MDLDSEERNLVLAKLSIYRKCFNVETDYGWRKSSYYLSDNTIARALNASKSTVGIFSTYQTNFFVIDIDNHDDKTDINLLYNQVYNKLGIPSLVSKSPRGLHVYYFLRDYYDANLLTSKIKSILKLNVEVKPTSNVSIRLFSKESLLDVITLEKNEQSLINYLNNAIVYNSSEFFYEQEKTQKRIKKDSIDIIFKGETNNAMNTLIPQWKSKGFSNEECVNKFIAKLAPSYTGDCRNYAHVLKRVECYKILPSKNNENISLIDIEKEYESLIQEIQNYYRRNSHTTEHNKNIRCANLKRLLVGILYAKKENEGILLDSELLSIYSSRYAYFEYEVKRGNIPLPNSFLKTIITNYSPLLDFLIRIGFIERKNGRSYDTSKHSCQYYYINTKCMNKFKEYSYSKLFNYQQLLDNFYHILNDKFNIREFIYNLFNHICIQFKEKEKSNICFNMFLGLTKEYQKEELILAG